tara:strand:+ start:187 stop:294 length:108 start_codon:yes stop_codon:yes gene_type:complete
MNGERPGYGRGRDHPGKERKTLFYAGIEIKALPSK